MANPAVRTSPLFTAAATARRITLRLIDASGDKWAEDILVPVAATAATIETIAADYQLNTQASLYAIEDVLIREGDADPDNADTLQRNSGSQGINLLFKNITVGAAAPLRVIAPVPAALQGNQDIPLLSATDMAALIVAVLAVKTGFNFRRAQYTDRRERKNNPVVS